jgi:uncharacterized protein (TIGR02594 family)
LRIARQELGVHELAGPENNARIQTYQRTTQLQAAACVDETPWCSAFVNWCFIEAGEVGTNRANARSWLQWGHAIGVPVLGCVVVFARDVPGEPAVHGHVGFYLRTEGSRVWVLGGNQHNRVCEADYPLVRVLSYRLPNRARPSLRPTARP